MKQIIVFFCLLFVVHLLATGDRRIAYIYIYNVIITVSSTSWHSHLCSVECGHYVPWCHCGGRYECIYFAKVQCLALDWCNCRGQARLLREGLPKTSLPQKPQCKNNQRGRRTIIQTEAERPRGRKRVCFVSGGVILTPFLMKYEMGEM